jgi:hypothetical protein
MQAVSKIAVSSRIMHPNIVSCQGISEHPASKDLLLVSCTMSHVWACVSTLDSNRPVHLTRCRVQHSVLCCLAKLQIEILQIALSRHVGICR